MKRLLALLLALILLFGSTVCALAETQTYTSPTLENWAYYYDLFLLTFTEDLDEAFDDAAMDTLLVTGNINYDENSFTYGPATGVPVIHGGAYSANGTVSLGMGTGLGENENYWYVSLTFSPECNLTTMRITSIVFLLAGIKAGVPLAVSDGSELTDLHNVLMSYDDIALQIGDYVLVHKVLSGDRDLLALDTLAYYDEFYYNDTENYYTLE